LKRFVMPVPTQDTQEISILELGPLCRLFREKVEESFYPLEESFCLLEDLCDLTLSKSFWLLPSPGGDVEAASGFIEEEEDEANSDGEGQDRCTLGVPIMGQDEMERGREELKRLLEESSLRFPRGFVFSGEGVFESVEAIDPCALNQVMQELIRRSARRERVVVVPKWNFLAHLRRFWREIRRLAAKRVVLRFSWFRGNEKREFIQNFLVFLELVKRGRVYARQEKMEEDIVFSTKREFLFGEVSKE